MTVIERDSLSKRARDARKLAVSRATWGGSQNFLGARWVEYLIDRSPAAVREQVALRFLSFSPHYFYARDIRAEAERNRISRIALANALIAPHVNGDTRVLDYGCGPGYLARAVAPMVRHVDAVDISRGVLACARAINGRPNITYREPADLARAPGQADLAYSFAVIQHLGQGPLLGMLAILADSARPGGLILLHFVVPDQENWRSEADWRASRSLANLAKLRYGLNCFARTPDEMTEIVTASGFRDVAIQALHGTISIPGDQDIPAQHLLTARRGT